jgi:hypothetical protein
MEMFHSKQQATRGAEVSKPGYDDDNPAGWRTGRPIW